MQLPRFHDDTSDADRTTEYSGRVEVIRGRGAVEIVTDVTMELLPDDTGQPSQQQRIAAAIASFPPVALEPPRQVPSSIPARRNPDASLEFPNPLRPELFADSTAELRSLSVLPTFDDDLDELHELPSTRREPPRWRLYTFAATMITCSALVGFAVAGRSRVTTVEETPTATKAAPIITRSTIALPDPASMPTVAATAAATAAAIVTATATATASAIAAPKKEKIGLLVTPLWAKGRNVWVDGVIFGVSPKVEAACGKHVVKVGDKGKARNVVIPCGGKVVVAP